MSVESTLLLANIQAEYKEGFPYILVFPKQLKHRSAITNWVQHLPIHVVQQLAGHSNIATTRKYYLAVRPEDMASANRIINNILESANSD